MNIGTKLHTARTNSQLTQEQVAEHLGVSRQSVSNWENERTYPDIISIVKLSDLYSVSLDFLLKDKEENAETATYLNYLEESTNTVRSNHKLSKIILTATYLLIWAISIIIFWLFPGKDAVAYSLMHLWIIQPVSIFVISLIIGAQNFFGGYKWAFTAIAGVMYMLSEYATFGALNFANSGNLIAPEFGMVFVGIVSATLGLLIGGLIYTIKNRKAKKQ